jgi:hypothetical protein
MGILAPVIFPAMICKIFKTKQVQVDEASRGPRAKETENSMWPSLL